MKNQEDWIWIKVENVGEIKTGTTPSKKKLEYYGEDYPFFKPTDLNNRKNVRDAGEYLSK